MLVKITGIEKQCFNVMVAITAYIDGSDCKDKQLWNHDVNEAASNLEDRPGDSDGA